MRPSLPGLPGIDLDRVLDRYDGLLLDGYGVVVDAGVRDAEAVVAADQKGFDCIDGMNRALSLILGRLDRGDRCELLLCNPDLIYPVAAGRYGFTAIDFGGRGKIGSAERQPPSHEPMLQPHLHSPRPTIGRRGGSWAPVAGGD